MNSTDTLITEVNDYLDTLAKGYDDDYWNLLAQAVAARDSRAVRDAEDIRLRAFTAGEQKRRWVNLSTRSSSPIRALKAFYMDASDIFDSNPDRSMVINEIVSWTRRKIDAVEAAA